MYANVRMTHCQEVHSRIIDNNRVACRTVQQLIRNINVWFESVHHLLANKICIHMIAGIKTGPVSPDFSYCALQIVFSHISDYYGSCYSYIVLYQIMWFDIMRCHVKIQPNGFKSLRWQAKAATVDITVSWKTTIIWLISLISLRHTELYALRKLLISRRLMQRLQWCWSVLFDSCN